MNTISSIIKQPYTVVLVVLALSVAQVFGLPMEAFLAVLIAWQTLRHGWQTGAKLLSWMLLPLIALGIDKGAWVMYAVILASCVVSTMIAAARHKKISWEVIICGLFLLGAAAAALIDTFAHLHAFWQQQYQQFFNVLLHQLKVTPAQINASKFSNLFQLTHHFFVEYGTAITVKYKLLWSLVYAAVANSIYRQSQMKPTGPDKHAVHQLRHPALALSLLLLSVITFVLNTHLATLFLMFSTTVFSCLGFYQFYHHCITKQWRKRLIASYVMIFILPTLAGLILAIYSIISHIRQLMATKTNHQKPQHDHAATETTPLKGE